MRKLKFRAWDKEKNIMVYEDTYVCDMTITFGGRVFCHDSYYGIRDSNFDLMQYTGLKDKQGKEIYEGDIVKHSIYQAGPFKVIYTPDNTGYDLTNGITSMHLGRLCEPDLEVIGNIYENPELIKCVK